MVNGMSNHPIYLSKDGKVTGPFSAGQIEDLRQSGELYNYAWIWENSERGWTAIEEEVEVPEATPIPPPPDALVRAAPVQENTPIRIERLKKVLDAIHVICHNRKTIMSGILHDAHEDGCVLQSLLPVQDLPTFKIGTPVSINLLNSQNGQSENTSATVKITRRGEEFWEYELTWDSLPKILDTPR